MAESKKTKAKKPARETAVKQTPKAAPAKVAARAATPKPVAVATPKPAKPSALGYDRKARVAIAKLADFIASLDGLPSRAVEQRNAALDACRDCGWEG